MHKCWVRLQVQCESVWRINGGCWHSGFVDTFGEVECWATIKREGDVFEDTLRAKQRDVNYASWPLQAQLVDCSA